MAIVVTTPIVSKPPKTRTTTGHAHSAPKPHVPRPPHVKAPPKPKAPRVTHARSSTHATTAAGITVAEQTQGQTDQNNLAAALNGGSFGSGATLPEGATPYTGPLKADGTPDTHPAHTIHIGPVPIGPAVHYFTPAEQKQRAANVAAGRFAGDNGPSSSGSGSSSSSRPPRPPKPPRVTAPLQLSDSGLLGHDSHISGPGTLSPIAPVVRRRPH